MKNVLLSAMVVFSISLAAFYFTTAKPVAEALTEEESQVLITVFRRVQNIERAKNVEVPTELKLVINGVPE